MSKKDVLLRGVLTVLLCLSVFSAYGQQYTKIPNVVELKRGEVAVFEVPSIERVAIGDSKVFSYKVLENGQLLVIAEEPGESSIHIWQHHKRELSSKVVVREEYISDSLALARKLAVNVPGLKVIETDGRMVFSGSVSEKDVEVFNTLRSIFPTAIPLVKVKPFDYEKMVRLDVTIVEIESADRERLGIRWDDVIAGPAVGVAKKFSDNSSFAVFSPSVGDVSEGILETIPVDDGSFYGYSGISTAISSQIDLMDETGQASILATPKLIAKNGEEATFHAGGEFPIQVVGATGTPEIQFKRYGIVVEINPLVDESNNIRTEVYAEISNIDFSVQLDGTPGLLQRNVESVINVKEGQTIVVSGLATATISKQESKVPWLGDIPFLGRLFSSTSESVDDKEVLIFVTPRVVDADSESNRNLLKYAADIKAPFEELDINKSLME